MRFSSRQFFFGSLVLVLFLLACALPLAISPAQEADPQSLEILKTMIVETAAFAQTKTAAALPPTLTPTLTREATSTLIAAPFTQTPFSLFTATPEFGISIETTDPLYAATEGLSGVGNDENPDYVQYTNRPWTCGIRSTIPRGDTIKAGAEFYAYWRVVNTGTKVWTSNTIDFIYLSGLKQEERRIQDLSSTVGSGGFVTLKVLFKAPKAPGTYTSIWTLKVGSQPFCGLKMFFEVAK